MSNNPIDTMISLGKELEETNNNAHDLWTWLPSYKATKQHHEDYVDNFTPTVKDIVHEANLYIQYLQRAKTTPLTDEQVDKIIFAIGNTHDQSELWGHLRRDASVFRLAVRLSVGQKPEAYTAEETEWFTHCACGEDHIPE